MIGLALARRFPGTSVIGIDKCEKAVALSNENAKLLGLKDSAYVAVCASAVEFSIKPDLKFETSGSELNFYLTKLYFDKWSYIIEFF